MYRAEGCTISSPELGMIYRGEVDVRAPVQDGNIQINSWNFVEQAVLHVERDRRGIQVAREDGEPVQVQVNRETDLGIERHEVFEAPVPVVRFEPRQLKGIHRYTGWAVLGEGVAVTNPFLVEEFAAVLGSRVSRKQEQTQAYPRFCSFLRTRLPSLQREG